MKKKTFIILSILINLPVFIFLLLILFVRLNVEPHELYTEDISQYNSEEYPINTSIFLDKLPDSLDVISFSYYDYWHEASDIYLELSFDAKEDFEAYLSDLKNYCISDFPSKYDKQFIEVSNPYNKNYTDLFCTNYWSYISQKYYTGYEITQSESCGAYSCNFGVISYSYEELRIIQAYSYGDFQDCEHDYVPKYFQRFNIPTCENHSRIFILDESD